MKSGETKARLATKGVTMTTDERTVGVVLDPVSVDLRRTAEEPFVGVDFTPEAEEDLLTIAEEVAVVVALEVVDVARATIFV